MFAKKKTFVSLKKHGGFLKSINGINETLNERLEEQQRLDKECFEKQNERLEKKVRTIRVEKKSKTTQIIFRRTLISEFMSSPEEEVTSAAYHRRYDEVFQKNCATWSYKKKCLLFGKFGQSEYEKYTSFILPRNPGEISFKENAFILKNIWREKFSVHHKMAVLKPDKNMRRNYSTFAGIVNRECGRFKLLLYV